MIDISVKDLVKSFDSERNVLDGISFDVQEGERVGLLGKNGAGKTTLFKILTGELDYNSGEIAFASGKKVGLISQIPIYPAGYTVDDVLRTAFAQLDRIRVQGRLDGHCTGGAICHLNIGSEITDAAVMKALIVHATESGVVYFAVNYQINRCADGHMTVGHNAAACPICKKPITDVYTRVVGFLTNTKHWNKTRREHDWPERKFAHA